MSPWRRILLHRARRRLGSAALPRHVGLVMDGNRRWARAAGHPSPSVGHRVGAEHLADALDWCVSHLTVYVLSADNIRKRGSAEVGFLMELLESVIPDRVRERPAWRLHVAGEPDLLPASTRDCLDSLVAGTVDRPRHLTLAIGYDGRGDIVRAIRSAVLAAGSGAPIEELIAAGVHGGPAGDLDLVIRTSGEQRLSGFFPWQAARAEIVVSPRMWPAFDELDFAQALLAHDRRRQRDR